MRTTEFRFSILIAAALLLATAALAGAGDIELEAARNGSAVDLSWTGGGGDYRVYRAANPATVVDPQNLLSETAQRSFQDTPPPGAVFFYRIDDRARCFGATADASVSLNSPDDMLGNEPELRIDGDDEHRALLRFQLSSIPSGSIIDGATLWLQQLDAADQTDIALRHVTANWSEPDVTWNTRPGSAGNYDQPVQSAGQGRRAWDATALVQDWVAGSTPDFGLALEGTQGTSALFSSREDNAGDLPELCVSWTEPGQNALDDLHGASEIPVETRIENGLATFVDAQVPTSHTDAVDAALEFLDRFAPLYGLTDAYGQLYLDRHERDDFDTESVIFGIRRGGIAVRGEQLLVLVENGTVLGTSTRHVANAGPTNLLALTDRQAVDLAQAKFEGSGFRLIGEPYLSVDEPSLYVPVDDPERLAWTVHYTGMIGEESVRREVLIDSETGDVLRTLEPRHNAGKDFDIQTVNETNSSTCWSMVWETADDRWFNENGPTGGYPGAGGDSLLDGQNASDFTHDTYDLFMNRFGRDSYDDNGMEVEAMVDVDFAGPNAAFDPGCNHMLFSNGWATQDIVAHEFTHGVIEHSSGLLYQNQSGAINESFSDIFGALLDGNWTVGENVSDGSAAPFRSLIDPPAFNDPDHMLPGTSGDNLGLRAASPAPNGSDDFGSVHTNSGIPNKAAFLIVDGGSHNGVPVPGMGDIKAGRLFYDLMTFRLGASAQFTDLRDTAVQTARQWARTGRHGFDHTDACTVINAYSSVGLGLPDTDCDGNANGPTEDGDGDYRADGVDNCPFVRNFDQRDTDFDGIGDACDDDIDGDGGPNSLDNCPEVWNPSQQDSDGNGIGDLCQDSDGDRVRDIDDNCPFDANLNQRDTDSDGVGDVCDNDDDNDGRDDSVDNCPLDPNFTQDDTDGDSTGDVCDVCPNLFDDQTDTDRDGMGNACDLDDDNDMVPDGDDNCPENYNPEQEDGDGDDIGHACDPDEWTLLDALGPVGLMRFLEDHDKLEAFVRFEIFPCTPLTCPDRLGPDFHVDLQVSIDAGYLPRVVDDRGRVLDSDFPNAEGIYDLSFRVDPDYFYRDGVTGEAFQGRRYFVEFMAPPGADPGQRDGTIELNGRFGKP